MTSEMTSSTKPKSFVDTLKRGQQFGRLEVIEIVATKKRRMVRCRCACGGEGLFPPYNLKSGRSRSCGCLRSDVTTRRNTRHGHSGSPLYKVWAEMIQRCTNRSHSRWPDYGGRGITVCERWMDFANFFADMGERPDDLSIDRINNDGNYEPGNCRWATHSQQNRNKRPRSRRSATPAANPEGSAA